jgi:UDP-N-acetylmuramyl pentapeptide phosphotransferase/UDP-N-acetylglucosamine-1-phosphate transferase
MSDQLALDTIKILALGTFSFVLAFLWTPCLTNFLYKHQLWRKKVRDKAIDGQEVTFFKKFHSEGEVNVPRFGGLLIWVTALVLVVFFFFISRIGDFGGWRS